MVRGFEVAVEVVGVVFLFHVIMICNDGSW